MIQVSVFARVRASSSFTTKSRPHLYVVQHVWCMSSLTPCLMWFSAARIAFLWCTRRHFPLDNIVVVDPDQFKSKMSEWTTYVKNAEAHPGDEGRAAGTLCHHESGYMQEITQEAALKASKNIWVDGSLKDGPCAFASFHFVSFATASSAGSGMCTVHADCDCNFCLTLLVWFCSFPHPSVCIVVIFNLCAYMCR